MRQKIIELEALKLLDEAITKGATDIHLVINERLNQIILRKNKERIKNTELSLTRDLYDYFRLISNHDLSNPMTPQTGAFSHFLEKEYFMRYSTIQTDHQLHGVIRILNQCEFSCLSECVSNKKCLKDLYKLQKLKHGLVLFTGATSTGKTTTLLNWLCSFENRLIYTVESPVERIIPNLIQVSVESEDMTRIICDQILRQDPDLIAFGEIRTTFDAEMCIKMALTGHLVCATLHCSTIDAVTDRLVDLKLSHYLIESCIKGVIHHTIKTQNNITKIMHEAHLY